MKPLLVMDQMGEDGVFRKLEELFAPVDYERLASVCEIVGGANWKMAPAKLDEHLEDMRFLVSMRPEMDRDRLSRAKNLKAIIEVGGHFPATVDYQACFDAGVQVLSCAPGFRESVAEMALGLMIAGGRGIVEEHQAFRAGYEHWYADNPATDFSLYRQKIGFVGFGSIARELTRLLSPFSPSIVAHDPWLKPEDVASFGVELASLEEVVDRSRCLVIAATPTDQNRGLVDKKLIQRMKRGTLVVLISRSHLVDFDELTQAARERRIRVAMDVFPAEPVPMDDPVRALPNSILSPHRAAAVEGGRRLIGRMIAEDVAAMIRGGEPTQLQKAKPDFVMQAVGAQRSVAK